MTRTGKNRWLTAQQTAGELDLTSAEVCRLLQLGRLRGSKQKDPKRGGTAQWLVNPKSIAKERKLRSARRAAGARRRKRAAGDG